jgi:hypothetical protein
MKKIVTFILLIGLVMPFTACTDKENTPPEITVQSLYDASNVPALLEKYDSVLVRRTENGEVYQEEYYSKEYRYTFDGYNAENEYAVLSTDHSYYMYFDNMYVRIVAIAPDGMVDMESIFAEEIDWNIFTTSLLNDTITSVTEKDGHIFVTSVSDQEEINDAKAQGWILGEEEYALDAKTREVISVKGVSVSDSGEKYEGAVYITYNAEIPESMKKFVEYDQQTADMRTVTVVSNPGAENEKIESIQVPKGLQVAISDAVAVEDENYTVTYTVYADAACTQTFEEEWDANSDLTVYIKWDE